MHQELAQPFSWKHHPNGFAHQRDAVAVFCNPVPQREIVGMVASHGFESANFLQPFFGDSHGPTEGEIYSTELVGYKHIC